MTIEDTGHAQHVELKLDLFFSIQAFNRITSYSHFWPNVSSQTIRSPLYGSL